MKIIKFEELESKLIQYKNEVVLIDSDVAELYGVATKEINQAVANNTNWINSVISNSKLSSQLAELASIDSLDQKIVVQEGVLDAKYANAKTIRGYKGNWEADTNNPVLSNGSGVVGDIYKVSIGGNIADKLRGQMGKLSLKKPIPPFALKPQLGALPGSLKNPISKP
jgi:hypothetical protein